jgi:hypothetical protein
VHGIREVLVEQGLALTLDAVEQFRGADLDDGETAAAPAGRAPEWPFEDGR